MEQAPDPDTNLRETLRRIEQRDAPVILTGDDLPDPATVCPGPGLNIGLSVLLGGSLSISKHFTALHLYRLEVEFTDRENEPGIAFPPDPLRGPFVLCNGWKVAGGSDALDFTSDGGHCLLLAMLPYVPGFYGLETGMLLRRPILPKYPTAGYCFRLTFEVPDLGSDDRYSVNRPEYEIIHPDPAFATAKLAYTALYFRAKALCLPPFNTVLPERMKNPYAYA